MPHYSDLETQYAERMQGRIQPTSNNNLVAYQTFCFTGTLNSMGRKNASSLVKNQRGYVSKSVTAAVDIVVAGQIPTTAIIAGELSLKLKKAKETGKQIISEDTFLQMIIDAGGEI